MGSQGLIHYVEMPRHLVDQPLAQDLPAFEARLCVQLNLARRGSPHGPALAKTIGTLSWDGFG